MERSRAWPSARLVFTASSLGAATDAGWFALYMLLIRSQSEANTSRVAFFATFVLLMGALSFTGAIAAVRFAKHDRYPGTVLIVAGAGNLGVGLLALLTIGFPLVFVGALLVFFGGRSPGSAAHKALYAVATVVVLGLGVVLT